MLSSRCGISASFAIVLSGCATGLPALPEEKTLPLQAVVQTINAEICNGIKGIVAKDQKNRSWLANWQGAYNITLKANEIGTLKDATNTFPIELTKSALMTFGVGAGYSQTANRTALFKFSIDLKEVIERPTCEAPVKPGGHPFVGGKIGFAEWLERAISASETDGMTNSMDKLTSIGHTFQFIVDVNGSISPGFSISSGSHIINLNPTGTGDRSDDDSVDVVFGAKVVAGGGTTVSRTISKPTKEQKDAFNIAVKSKIAADAKIASIERLLNEQPNKSIIEKELSLNTLRNKFILMTKPQTQANSAGQKEIQDTQKSIDEISKSLNDQNNIPVLQNVSRLKSQLNEAKIEKNNAEKQIALTKKAGTSSSVVTTTTTNFISPELNPNVAGTLGDLAIQRVFGNLRVNGIAVP